MSVDAVLELIFIDKITNCWHIYRSDTSFSPEEKLRGESR